MDIFTKSVMSVIALALCAIAVRVWMPGYATWGEGIRIGKMENAEAKARALEEWRSRLIFVRLQGGTVDVDVSSFSPTIDVNVTGVP